MLKRTDKVGPPERDDANRLRWMARLLVATEWQLAFRDQNAFGAKQRAMVQMGCEPWEVEIAPYSRDANRRSLPDQPSAPAELGVLEDLVRRFPIGDGRHWILVVRRAPKSWGGYRCLGAQESIDAPMTTEQFVQKYGGGEYGLTVFGPQRKTDGGERHCKSVFRDPLTEEVHFVVPYEPPFGAPPNPEACIHFGVEASADRKSESGNGTRRGEPPQ